MQRWDYYEKCDRGDVIKKTSESITVKILWFYLPCLDEAFDDEIPLIINEGKESFKKVDCIICKGSKIAQLIGESISYYDIVNYICKLKKEQGDYGSYKK